MLTKVSPEDVRRMCVHIVSDENDQAAYDKEREKLIGTFQRAWDGGDIFVYSLRDEYFIISDCGQRSLWSIYGK